MKVATVTFNGAHNNGAQIQAYALQKFLEKEGHQVNVINYRLQEIANSYRIIKHRKRKIFLLDKAIYGYKWLELQLKYRYKYNKRDKFEHFINNTLNVTEEYKTLNDLRNANLNYDAYICGSDQIWNYNITKGVKPAFFLDFGNKDAKRISYAASLGIDKIPEEYKDIYQKNLMSLDFISVREESAKKELSPLTNKNVTVVLDPTLLLDAEDYDDICKEPTYKEKYIYYHQLIEDPEMFKIAKHVASTLGVKIVTNLSEKKFKNELDRVPDMDPTEFLGLIKNAEFVITNSFHATVFSLVYKKRFISVPHLKYPTRVINLLTIVDHKHLMISVYDPKMNLDDLKFDYKKVEKLLSVERKKSIEFLRNSLNSEKEKVKPSYLKSHNKFSCYGCSACKNVCPVNAIKMIEDNEGFIYPQVEEDKCIHCGLCEKTCIFNKEKLFNSFDEQKVYAAKNNNIKVRQTSTSGGMFSALVEEVLSKGGYVVGVELDENKNVIYSISDLENYEKYRGAKYVRAEISDIYLKAKKLVVDGNNVLFSGTPCIIAGFKSFLNKEYDNLFLVDIVCHSNSSPKVLNDYIKALEEKENSKIKKFNFRDKKTGWRSSSVIISFLNRTVKEDSVYTNNYTANFLLGNMSRPSCYNCEFAGQKRVGDITIGDYWGISGDIDDGMGTSLVMVNNSKGEKLFKSLSKKIEYIETPKEQALVKNHNTPINIEPKRYNFFNALKDNKLLDVLEEYNTRTNGTMGFGNAAPIYFRTKKNVCILSTCVSKAHTKDFKVGTIKCKGKFLFGNGIPFIAGYKVNIYFLKIPVNKIIDQDIQNKVTISIKLNNGALIDCGIAYDLFNLRKGKNRNSRIFMSKKTGTSFYFRQSIKNGLYLTVRESHKTDLRRNQTKIFISKILSKLTFKMDIILLFEKESSTYEESASVLYEKLIDMGYNNVYYILDKNYPYMNEIKPKYRKHIIYKLSYKHFIYFFKCKTFISTESLAHAIDLRIANRYAVIKIQDKSNKFVFLQHGVMYMVSLSSELRKKAEDYDKFYKVVVSSEEEAKHFIELGGYKKENMYICGLPKYDKNTRNKNADKIVIMLTWRRWEYNSIRTNFEETKYYKFIERIIAGVPKEYRDKIVVLPHPLFLKLVKNSSSELSKYMPESDFRYDEVLKDVKLLITDYSSISYDAFYRGANVIFCFEEKDECLTKYGESSKLMLNDKNTFGDICYDVSKLSKLVTENYNKPQSKEHVNKYKKIVEFNDNKNTDRLISMLKKDKVI